MVEDETIELLVISKVIAPSTLNDKGLKKARITNINSQVLKVLVAWSSPAIGGSVCVFLYLPNDVWEERPRTKYAHGM